MEGNADEFLGPLSRGEGRKKMASARLEYQ